jgi:hypothetical protein
MTNNVVEATLGINKIIDKALNKIDDNLKSDSPLNFKERD